MIAPHVHHMAANYTPSHSILKLGATLAIPTPHFLFPKANFRTCLPNPACALGSSAIKFERLVSTFTGLPGGFYWRSLLELRQQTPWFLRSSSVIQGG